MKQARSYPQATVTKKAETLIRSGHPWVYDTEVLSMDKPPENGALTDVLSEHGSYLGTAFYSQHSKIRLRFVSRNANDRFDEEFWERRIRYAWEYRKTVLANDTDSCRVIFGEADQFPGLTVDKFQDVLVTQTLSYGMEHIKPVLFPILQKVLSEKEPIRGIYERNDVAIREREGLEQAKGWFRPETVESPENHIVKIRENGITFTVDFKDGQKTGYFLDQKYNRQAVARIAYGKRVLDCFSHTGSFALNAANGGATYVHAVDVSQAAIDCAKENASLNGFTDRIQFETADVFDLLPSLLERKEHYDLIILDPPAFTKSRKTAQSAARGYKEINYRAMRLLPRGGYLATCTCSHFMGRNAFERVLNEAAQDAGVGLRQIEARQQSPDHPILWNVPETDYLKFYLFQVF